MAELVEAGIPVSQTQLSGDLQMIGYLVGQDLERALHTRAGGDRGPAPSGAGSRRPKFTRRLTPARTSRR